MHRPRRLPSTLLAAVLLAGCSSGAGSATGGTAAEPAGPTHPDVSGTWTGGLLIEGQAIDGTLELTQDAGDLTGLFSAPEIEVSAEGSGTISPAGEIRIVLGYDLQCPGTAEMVGSRSSDGASLSGVVQASDCTGQTSGSFEFHR